MLSTMQDEQLSLATLLRYAADFRGDSTISTWTGDGVRTMSYRELGEQAAQLANALRSLGIGIGDRVATFMWNNNEHMVAYAGVPAMGAVLHALNIRLFPEQLTYVANHAEDQVVIVDASLLPTFAPNLPHMKSVRHVIVVGGDPDELTVPAEVDVHSYSELLSEQRDTYDFPVLDERSAAGVCYTSGTTGAPKGVVYSHRSNWLHATQVIAPDGMGFASHDTVLAIVPLFHANAWGLPYGAMMSGADMLLPDRYLQPWPLLQMMSAVEPTFAAAVPTIWGGVLAALDAQAQDISYLRTVLVGGAAVPPSMMRAFEDKYDVRLLHAWGMTETSPLGSVAHPPPGMDREQAWTYRCTQGRFPAAVQARLVADDDSVVPNDGESLGELEVRGPWITGTYYSPEGAQGDQAKFRGGWLRTGDVGHISADGYFTLVDRSKDVIKSGGEWISSVDLENAIMGHPMVAEAAVIGVPDAKWDERPLVAIILTDGTTTESLERRAMELRNVLSDKFAKWQLPERWVFLDEIPKTSVGKFDKRLLRAQYSQDELRIITPDR